MVQFLSIIFFLDFFNFCWVFQKFPFLCVTLYLKNHTAHANILREQSAEPFLFNLVVRIFCLQEFKMVQQSVH